MLEWTRNNVPDLRAIRVTPGYRNTGFRANLVVITAFRTWDHETPPIDLVECDWAEWKAQTFPPRVCGNVIMSCTFQPVPTS